VSRPFPHRAVAACFALACFAVALLSGLMVNREAGGILQSAIFALLGGQILGHLFAWGLARTFAEALASEKRAEAGTPTAGGRP
jgi:hypothetical protein